MVSLRNPTLFSYRTTGLRLIEYHCSASFEQHTKFVINTFGVFRYSQQHYQCNHNLIRNRFCCGHQYWLYNGLTNNQLWTFRDRPGISSSCYCHQKSPLSGLRYIYYRFYDRHSRSFFNAPEGPVQCFKCILCYSWKSLIFGRSRTGFFLADIMVDAYKNTSIRQALNACCTKPKGKAWL